MAHFITSGPGSDLAGPGDIKFNESVWSSFLVIVLTVLQINFILKVSI